MLPVSRNLLHEHHPIDRQLLYQHQLQDLHADIHDIYARNDLQRHVVGQVISRHADLRIGGHVHSKQLVYLNQDHRLPVSLGNSQSRFLCKLYVELAGSRRCRYIPSIVRRIGGFFVLYDYHCSS